MKLLAALPVMVLAFVSCSKEKVIDSARKPTPYFVRMTDAPGNFTGVNVDIVAVEITASGVTTTLNTNAGVYNLLDFTNGKDTLIATGSLQAERVQQIRLILGPGNSVVVDSVTYPLEVPSGAQSGLKLQVHQDLAAGVAYEVLLDFDANASIVLEGNNTYKLKPVIRTMQTALSGAIQGSLSVAGVNAAITASSQAGVWSTAPASNGEFIIKGVPAGTYTVMVVPAAPHSSATVNGVQVSTGMTSTLGVIQI